MGRSLMGFHGAIATLLCVGLLLSVTTESREVKASTTMATLEDFRVSSRDHMDRFNESKRKVPNGPDPIHNRRAGKSGRPQGRA